MRKTLLLAHSYCNHSNKLIQAVHFEAYCLARGYRFVHLDFCEMRKYYSCFSAVRLRSSSLRALRRLLLSTGFDVHGNIHTPSDLDSLFSRRFILVSGWSFRCTSYVRRYRDYFVCKYTPKPSFLLSVPLATMIDEWQREGKKVVGLHVRRGDYAQWENGRYFYADEVYSNTVQRVRSLLLENRDRTEFIVFSNESEGLSVQLGLQRSDSSWVVDHYLMSKCDYLVGPPSTFTMWASFVGNAQYYHLRNPKDDFCLKDFRHCRL